MRKLIHPAAVMLACAALSAALAYAAAPKNLDRAIDAQRALILERPEDSKLENDLGSLLVLGDDLVGAEQAYRRAIELDAENASAHYNLGLLLQRQGERRDALKEFKRTIELEPRHAWAHYQEGTIYHHQGRDSSAKKAYARALAIDPGLANPEINPHMIENELATSAMLYSYQHYREELLPEKEFEEPARIAGVLIDRPTTDVVATTGPEAAAGGGFVRNDGATPENHGTVAETGDGNGEGDSDGSTKPEPPDGDSAESRVLTSRDLDPTRTSGQIVGGGAPARGSKAVGPAAAARGRTRDAQPAPRHTLRPPSNSGTMQPQQPAAPSTFLPTSDSTGMIEVRLVEIDEWS